MTTMAQERPRRWGGAALSLLLLSVAAGCGDENTMSPPRPGTALVSMTAPSETGAVLITIAGPGLSSAQGAGATTEVSWRLASSTELRAVVAGRLVSGPLLSIPVPDLGRLDEYSGAVVEAADRSGRLHASPGSYELTFEGAGGG